MDWGSVDWALGKLGTGKKSWEEQFHPKDESLSLQTLRVRPCLHLNSRQGPAMCLENNYQIKTFTFQCSQCSRTDMHCSVCTLKGRIDESHMNVSQPGKHTLISVHTPSSPDPWRSEFQAWNPVEKLNASLCLWLQVSTSECNTTIPLNSHIHWRSVHVSLLIK